MTLIDIIIIVLAIAGAYIGWRKGLTGQLGSLAGVLLAIILCRWFARDLANAFARPGDTPETVMLHTVLAYAVIAVAAYVGVRLAAGLIRKVMDALHLSVINRAAGAVFGLFEWLLGLSLMLNLWLAFFPETELRSKNTVVTDTVLVMGPAVLGSDTFKDILDVKDLQRPDFLGGHEADSLSSPADSLEHAVQ